MFCSIISVDQIYTTDMFVVNQLNHPLSKFPGPKHTGLKLEGIFGDSNSIYLWHESENIE